MRSWGVAVVVAVVVCGAGAELPRDYLAVMKAHFDGSLKYLFKSFQFSGQAVQRPGMANLLRQKSDRHWQEGMDFMKKYFQKGGQADNSNFQSLFSYQSVFTQLPETLHPSSSFSSEMNDFFVKEMSALTQHTKDFANQIKAIKLPKGHRDPDMANFIQEKHEHEVQSVREFTLANRNLELMYTDDHKNGMALYMFDQSLQ